MKLIYIASPFAGDIEHNIEFAKEACRHAIEHGHAFFAPHLLYPQVLADSNPQERETGMEMGLQVLSRCDELWAYGEQISPGMQQEITGAGHLGIPVKRILVQDEQFAFAQYGIWATRNAASIWGAAERWCNQDGEPMVFSDYAAAIEHADALNSACNSRNVQYAVKLFSLEPNEFPTQQMEVNMELC